MSGNKLYESLEQLVDAVANGDEETEANLKKDIIKEKTKSVLEFIGDSKIKLDGDDVMIAGKKVGEIKSDASDMESGISFVSDDGKFSKEFNTINELYSFLSDRYNVKEGVLELDEGRVEDAVNKQDTGREARSKRWSAVRSKKHKDGTPGDYESGDLSDYHDSIKGKSGEAAYDDHEKDPRHKKGYYDSKDPRKQHKDAIKGGSEPAHQGAASDLETDGGYDSHDVSKHHNK